MGQIRYFFRSDFSTFCLGQLRIILLVLLEHVLLPLPIYMYIRLQSYYTNGQKERFHFEIYLVRAYYVTYAHKNGHE